MILVPLAQSIVRLPLYELELRAATEKRLVTRTLAEEDIQ